MANCWTPDEDTIVNRTYPKHGLTATVHALHRHGHTRTRNAVRNRASKLLLSTADPTSLVPLRDVHARPTGHINKCAMTAARRDGVLVDRKGTRPRYLVPERWADAYTERLRVYEDARRDGWLPTRRFAARLGVTPRRVRKALSGGESVALTRVVRNAPHVSVGYTRLFDPEGVRRAVSAYRRAA